MARDTTAPGLVTTGAVDDDTSTATVAHPAAAPGPAELQRVRVLEALRRYARRTERDR